MAAGRGLERAGEFDSEGQLEGGDLLLLGFFLEADRYSADIPERVPDKGGPCACISEHFDFGGINCE